MPNSLDAIDHRILRVMANDARITWNDLATQVGLSVTPTLRRVRLMEQSGVIRGYSVVLDEHRMLGSLGVMISVTLDRQVRTTLDKFENHILQMPEVMFGYLMSGSQDYLIKAFVRDLDHYRDMLAVMTEIEGISHIQSSFILKSAIDRRNPVPRDDTISLPR